MKKKIYISIPISGFPLQEVREKADLVKHMLSRRGYDPVNPLEIYVGADPEYADYICSDLHALMGCDGIYFCRGWERSCGCNIEHDVVMRLKAHGRKEFEVMYEE